MDRDFLKELNEVVAELESHRGFEREASSLHNIFMKLSQFADDEFSDIKDMWSEMQQTGKMMRLLYTKKGDTAPSDYMVGVDDSCDIGPNWMRVVIHMKNGSREGYPRYSRLNFSGVQGLQKQWAKPGEYDVWEQ